MFPDFLYFATDRTAFPALSEPDQYSTTMTVTFENINYQTTYIMGFNYQKMQLSQVKYLNDMADAFLNRTERTSLRNGILEKQWK